MQAGQRNSKGNKWGNKLSKSIADIKYKGNAHDIRHLLKDGLHTKKQTQFEINLRDDSESPRHQFVQKLVTGYQRIKKNRVKHFKDFDWFPLLRKSLDFENFLPADKESISKYNLLLKHY